MKVMNKLFVFIFAAVINLSLNAHLINFTVERDGNISQQETTSINCTQANVANHATNFINNALPNTLNQFPSILVFINEEHIQDELESLFEELNIDAFKQEFISLVTSRATENLNIRVELYFN